MGRFSSGKVKSLGHPERAAKILNINIVLWGGGSCPTNFYYGYPTSKV